VIEPHCEILQTRKTLHGAVFGVRMAYRTDLTAAALCELLLMTAGAGCVATLARKADPAGIIVTAMTEQTRHPRMRRIRVKESGKVTGLRLRDTLERYGGPGLKFVVSGLTNYCVTDERARCDQQNKIDGPLSQF
jgi:hypothetical protein